MLEINCRLENLQRIAVLAQRFKMLRQAKKAPLIHETGPPRSLPGSESRTGEIR